MSKDNGNLKPVRNPKTADDWAAKVAYMKEQLKAAKASERKQRALEKQQEEQAERDRQFKEAVQFMEFSKKLFFKDGTTSYYDQIMKKMGEADSVQNYGSEFATKSEETNSGEQNSAVVSENLAHSWKN